jgi:Putative oxidoreductase C terminal domain
VVEQVQVLRTHCRTGNSFLSAILRPVVPARKSDAEYDCEGDLSRYFGGEVLLDTVQATSLEWFEDAGNLDVVPVDENAIPEDQRVPRVTSATW